MNRMIRYLRTIPGKDTYLRGSGLEADILENHLQDAGISETYR